MIPLRSSSNATSRSCLWLPALLIVALLSDLAPWVCPWGWSLHGCYILIVHIYMYTHKNLQLCTCLHNCAVFSPGIYEAPCMEVPKHACTMHHYALCITYDENALTSLSHFSWLHLNTLTVRVPNNATRALECWGFQWVECCGLQLVDHSSWCYWIPFARAFHTRVGFSKQRLTLVQFSEMPVTRAQRQTARARRRKLWPYQESAGKLPLLSKLQ